MFMSKVYAQEDNKVLELVGSATKILDYGCGLGRYLYRLNKTGQFIMGVDINPKIVKLHQEKGFNVCLPQDFYTKKQSFDCIILSHIIEHINPNNLMIFMDRIIEKLDVGGKLIISTPLLYDEFYDDYDHVKPYTHKSITILFSDYLQQSAKPNNRLECNYVWFRRWPFTIPYRPGQSKIQSLIKRLINTTFELIFFLSCGFISRKTGWVGVFKKF